MWPQSRPNTVPGNKTLLGHGDNPPSSQKHTCCAQHLPTQQASARKAGRQDLFRGCAHPHTHTKSRTVWGLPKAPLFKQRFTLKNSSSILPLTCIWFYIKDCFKLPARYLNTSPLSKPLCFISFFLICVIKVYSSTKCFLCLILLHFSTQVTLQKAGAC